jgi:hypothetical protein
VFCPGTLGSYCGRPGPHAGGGGGPDPILGEAPEPPTWWGQVMLLAQSSRPRLGRVMAWSHVQLLYHATKDSRVGTESSYSSKGHTSFRVPISLLPYNPTTKKTLMAGSCLLLPSKRRKAASPGTYRNGPLLALAVGVDGHPESSRPRS